MAPEGWTWVTDGGNPELVLDGNYLCLQITGVPEPATMSLLAIGGIAILRRRSR